MGRTEEAGIARVVGRVLHAGREADVGALPARWPLELRHHRAKLWPATLRLSLVAAAGHALKRIVGPGRSHDRPHNRQLVGDLRQLRHQLADLDPRHIGGDRAKLPADLRGRIGLEVDHVLVRRPARQEDHDHRLLPRTRSRLGPQQLGHREARHTAKPGQRTDPQKPPPRAHRTSGDRQAVHQAL